MTIWLRVAMALSTVPAAGLLLLLFLRQRDFSALSVGRWAALGVVSCVLPTWWSVSLERRLRRSGIEVPAAQLFMPVWCAAVAAVLAASLVR